jgi:hypothetical protein
MILSLPLQPDSTKIYKPRDDHYEGSNSKPFRSTTGHTLQQTCLICLLSRGPQVRVLPGAPFDSPVASTRGHAKLPVDDARFPAWSPSPRVLELHQKLIRLEFPSIEQ